MVSQEWKVSLEKGVLVDLDMRFEEPSSTESINYKEEKGKDTISFVYKFYFESKANLVKFGF